MDEFVLIARGMISRPQLDILIHQEELEEAEREAGRIAAMLASHGYGMFRLVHPRRGIAVVVRVEVKEPEVTFERV